MPDELDAQLLRWFAQSRAPLDDAQFAVRVTAKLHGARSVRVGRAARSILAAIFSGFATGIAAPLRLRHAPLLALVAAAVTLWSVMRSL